MEQIQILKEKLTQNNTQELGDRKYNQMNNKLNNNYYNQNVNDKILEYDSLSFNDKKFSNRNEVALNSCAKSKPTE